MSSCHASNNAKGDKNTRRNTILAIVAISIMVFIFFIMDPSKNNSNNAAQQAPSAVGSSEGYVKIPLSELSTSIKKYNYNVNGVEVRFFAVLGSDGKARTAIDACDVCGGYGYAQDGKEVSCNKCGRAFSIDDIGTKNTPGGCWPSYLANSADSDYVAIDKNDLEKSASRFA